MIIEQVKKYNARMLAKWNKDVEEWKQDKNTHNIIPQLVFYLFWNEKGFERELGYVASNSVGAYWGRTKKEVLKRFNKNYE